VAARKKDPRTTVRRHRPVTPEAMEAPQEDLLAVEEPLEIRVQGRPIARKMRTPGDDFDFAVGYLFARGLIRARKDVRDVRYCEEAGEEDMRNVVDVLLSKGVDVDKRRVNRGLFMDSSYGISSRGAVESVCSAVPALNRENAVRLAVLFELGQSLREAKKSSERGEGLHAAAIADMTGRFQVFCEDVDRHNVVDKAVGTMLMRGELPLENQILLVTGRASFDVCAKALLAGITVVLAVSSPSSLAVRIAKECGMTLVGFLGREEMNIYSGAGRVKVDPKQDS
jgi:FdhD protein